MKKILLICVFSSITFLSVKALTGINGSVVYKNSEAAAFANIVLKQDYGQIVNGAVCDDKGYYQLKNVKAGNYHLKISTIGYKAYESSVHVPNDMAELEIPQIVLEPTTNDLNEVVVTATANVSEIKPGVIKYKTSSLVSQNGGTAGDILKNMPSVSMGGSPGHNRDIRFRGLGNAYTKVLINGRETGLSGNNRETILDQIPASSISHIEIISVPGAEYQAEGINGVVNIVLKENANFGTHGKLEAFAGNKNTLGGNVSVSQKTEKLNMYLNYDFLNRSLPKYKDKVKTDYKDGAPIQLENAFEVENKSFENRNLRTGFDFHLQPKTKFSAEYIYGYQLEDKSKTLTTSKTTPASVFKSATEELKTEYKPNVYHQFNGGFEHYFQNQARFQATMSYQTEQLENMNEKSVYSLTKTGKWANFKPAFENNQESQQGERWLWNVGVSKWQLGKHNVMALGYAGEQESRLFNKKTDKFNYADTSWVSSNNGFDNFKVTETTHALYVSDEYKYSFLRLKAGLRYELTNTSSNASLASLTGSRIYGLLLPSLQLTANIDKTQHITFNFGKRIRRPGFKDLNPFTEVKDDANLKKGNPNLLPEKAWAYELGYLKNFNKFNFGGNLFYRSISDLIQTVKTSDDNFIVTEQPVNLGSAYVAGYELMTTIKPIEWWQVTASFSQFESAITSGDYLGDALNDQYKWSAKLITDFNLKGGWVIQVAGNIVGPKISSTKTEGTIWFVDLGVEKRFLNNGRIFVRATDIFESIAKDKTETTSNTYLVEHEYADGRIISAGLSWNF